MLPGIFWVAETAENGCGRADTAVQGKRGLPQGQATSPEVHSQLLLISGSADPAQAGGHLQSACPGGGSWGPPQRIRSHFHDRAGSLLCTLWRARLAHSWVLVQAYAMTEASHQMTSNPLPKHGAHKPGQALAFPIYKAPCAQQLSLLFCLSRECALGMQGWCCHAGCCCPQMPACMRC